MQHSYQSGWYLPGGTVERGESLYHAAIRELLEECAIRAKSVRLLGMFFSEIEGRSDHIALFTVESFDEVANHPRDPEIADLRFFPLDRLPEGTSPATRRRLSELKTGAAPPDRW